MAILSSVCILPASAETNAYVYKSGASNFVNEWKITKDWYVNGVIIGTMKYGYDKTFYNEDWCNTAAADTHKGGLKRLARDGSVQWGPEKTGASAESWKELRHYAGDDKVQYWAWWFQTWGTPV